MSSARAAVAEAIWGADEGALPYYDPEEMPGYGRMADAAIAAHANYLWQQPDRPEVQKSVAGAIGGGGPNSMDAYNPDNISAAIRANVTLLTMLIGPREDTADDQH